MRTFLSAVATALLAASAILTAGAAPFVYVPLAGDGLLQVIDLADNRVINTIRTGTLPIGVAVSPTGHRVFVTNNGPAQVEVFDTATGQRIGAIPVGAAPYALAMHPDGTRLYVSLTGVAAISEIDTTTLAVTDTLSFNVYPLDLVLDASGSNLYFAAPDANSIGVIQTRPFRFTNSLRVGRQPGPLALTPSGILFIGDLQRQGVGHTVGVVRLDGAPTVTSISVGNFPNGLALSPDARRLYVANRNSDTVSVVDVEALTEVATVRVGRAPVSVDVHPDGSRIYVVNNGSEHMSVIDATTLQTLADVRVGPNGAAIGRFVGPATGLAESRPGPLTGLWWNPAESGWGVHLTQRRDVVFAAWFTYDAAGAPRWYTASDCRIASLPCPTCVSGVTCTGTLYDVSGPRFFDAAYLPSAVRVSAAGTLSIAFQNADQAAMTYEVAGHRRTVGLSRQQFAPATPAPGLDYTDLWWNPSESGWGLAITQQGATAFLAWFVYDAAGRPTWYVASACAMNAAGTGCTGDVYRTAGPPFGPTFDASRVSVGRVGTLTLSFTGPDNAVLAYAVDGTSGIKTLTRQRF